MMQHNRWRIVAGLALLAGLLSAFGISQAVVQVGGTGPADALPVPAGTQTLAAGQKTWYGFGYAGDASPVLVRLNASPPGSVSFAVWSPSDVERWAHGGAASPVGRGSTSAVYGGDLIWAGSSRFPGTWYVVVEPAGATGGTFTLQISGSGVTVQAATALPPSPTYSLPLPAPYSVGTAQPAVAALATPRASTAAAAASAGPAFRPYPATPTRPAQHPAVALPVTGAAQTLAPGQHLWYAFQYVGDKSRILIDLHASPEGFAAFDVWSPGQIRLWGLRFDVDPDGRGSPNADMGGDLVWTGISKVPGTWYVEVRQTGAAASTFTLQITGSGVRYDLPPTPTPTPAYSLPLPAPFSLN